MPNYIYLILLIILLGAGPTKFKNRNVMFTRLHLSSAVAFGFLLLDSLLQRDHAGCPSKYKGDKSLLFAIGSFGFRWIAQFFSLPFLTHTRFSD